MIGIDIVNVDRFEKHDMSDFLGKVFNQKEVDYINSRKHKHQTAAGIFAAKEAIGKALGTGFDGKVKFCDITVQTDGGGRPFATLTGGAEQVFKQKGSALDISISHTNDVATAVAIIR